MLHQSKSGGTTAIASISTRKSGFANPDTNSAVIGGGFGRRPQRLLEYFKGRLKGRALRPSEDLPPQFRERRLPCTKPPWGTLAAINLTSGGLQFEVPLGYMPDPEQFPDAKQWGSVSFCGPMTTASGLTFIAATVDGHLHAIDTETGELLWEAMGTKLGDYVVAYALPAASMQAVQAPLSWPAASVVVALISAALLIRYIKRR